jgi:hypothetical protein
MGKAVNPVCSSSRDADYPNTDAAAFHSGFEMEVDPPLPAIPYQVLMTEEVLYYGMSLTGLKTPQVQYGASPGFRGSLENTPTISTPHDSAPDV